MATLIVTHEVEDVAHWLASPRREEFFGPMGFSHRTFVDPEIPIRSALSSNARLSRRCTWRSGPKARMRP